MTIVEGGSMGDPRDQFPIGMRVLAVDDDPTCLMVLETLLRRCQYHVTVTTHAITALKMLRENKNKFDLVISDVVMPDMDGFKLLELVGLEMDLPVIMVSANDDPKMVMKGITHGACHYLLKPIRIEELMNIWQHVIRRKKTHSITSNQEMTNSGSYNAIESPATANSYQNGKSTKKRKDHDEDEDHENNDDEDPSTHKKPRFVWSMELHRKFVDAVNQLGIEMAVPKKILDLMNVEKLTRNNVASHLQKYRLYMKRIGCVTNQQANMVAALGSADSSYLRMGYLSGFGHFQTSSGAGQFHNNAFISFPTSEIRNSNTSTALDVYGLPFFGTHQLGHAQNLNNSTNDQLKFRSVIGRGYGYGNGVQNLNTRIDGKLTFPISSKLPDQDQIPKVTTNNALMLEANHTLGGGLYENSNSVASRHSEFSFSLVDRSNDIWSTVVQTFSYLPSECFRQATMLSPDNNFSIPLQGGILSGASPIASLSSQFPDMHSRGVFSTNEPRQLTSNVPFQWWVDHNQDLGYHSNVTGNSISSLIPVNAVVDPEGHTSTNSTFNRSLEFRFCDPLQMKHVGIMEFNEENSLKPHQVYTMNQQKSQNSCIDNNLGSLEDLVIEMMNEKDDEVKLLDGDFLSNNDYSGGTSM